MIITRKLEIAVWEKDVEVKKKYIKQIFDWRYLVRCAANELVSYLYSIDIIKNYKFITQQSKIELGIIGAKGDNIQEGSATYSLLSERLKGKLPMSVATALQHNIKKSYSETKYDLLRGTTSLRAYNNIPIPFGGTSLRNFHYNDLIKNYYFTLFKIPFIIIIGKDRSNNKEFLANCIAEKYKICGSSILIDDKKKKMFLLLNVKIPQIIIPLNENNCIDAYLSLEIPIIAKFKERVKNIGNKEEYLHRRLQIQQSLRRAQTNAKYSVGGKGRKRKMQALDRFHKVERDYINTKLHTYAKILVEYAIKNSCKTINLVNQKQKEAEASNDRYLLRNWGYYGLKQKLCYKANIFGIQIKEVD
ncbi:MAG: hypothetical protein AB9833_04210 [Bacteroidales bacterium]